MVRYTGIRLESPGALAAPRLPLCRRTRLRRASVQRGPEGPCGRRSGGILRSRLPRGRPSATERPHGSCNGHPPGGRRHWPCVFRHRGTRRAGIPVLDEREHGPGGPAPSCAPMPVGTLPPCRPNSCGAATFGQHRHGRSGRGRAATAIRRLIDFSPGMLISTVEPSASIPPHARPGRREHFPKRDCELLRLPPYRHTDRPLRGPRLGLAAAEARDIAGNWRDFGDLRPPRRPRRRRAGIPVYLHN